MVHQYRVAILGATGAVGQEFLGLLQRRNFPVSAVRLLASPRSMGRTFKFRNAEIPVQVVSDAAFEGVNFSFFSAGSEASHKWAPIALERGSVVIDNSSAFRMDPHVPLVIPEINWHRVQQSDRLFPVGNCTGIILMMSVAPLRKFGRIRRIVASTYQSASGAGARAMEELAEQTRAIAQGRTPAVEVFPHQIALNLFSHNTPVNELGYNQEEWKVIQEVRKTLDMPDLAIDITCIRVPVMRAHSISANIEFDGPAPSVEAMREAVTTSPGLALVDDRESNRFPMPTLAAGRDEVLVGRLRQDAGNPNAVSLFASGDQLLKGAALNGVQIAESLIAESRVPAPVA